MYHIVIAALTHGGPYRELPDAIAEAAESTGRDETTRQVALAADGVLWPVAEIRADSSSVRISCDEWRAWLHRRKLEGLS